MNVAVVTGASRGLGQAIADELSRDFHLALASRSIYPHWSGNRLTRQLDVGSPMEVDRFVYEVMETWGQIDVLVNNAGYASRLVPMEETLDLDLARSFQVNVFGPFYLMQKVIPIMRRQEGGGVVINVSSKSAMRPVPNLAIYSASKAALKAMTTAVAKEQGDESNVVCVTVCPGGMNDQLRSMIYGQENAKLQQDPKDVAKVVGEIARRRPIAQGTTVLVTKDHIRVYSPEKEDELLGL